MGNAQRCKRHGHGYIQEPVLTESNTEKNGGSALLLPVQRGQMKVRMELHLCTCSSLQEDIRQFFCCPKMLNHMSPTTGRTG